MKISTEEILAELRAFKAPVERPTGAFTVEEAASSAGLGITAMRDRIREWVRSGRIELVTFQIEAMNGKVTRTVGYRIKAKAKAGR